MGWLQPCVSPTFTSTPSDLRLFCHFLQASPHWEKEINRERKEYNRTLVNLKPHVFQWVSLPLNPKTQQSNHCHKRLYTVDSWEIFGINRIYPCTNMTHFCLYTYLWEHFCSTVYSQPFFSCITSHFLKHLAMTLFQSAARVMYHFSTSWQQHKHFEVEHNKFDFPKSAFLNWKKSSNFTQCCSKIQKRQRFQTLKPANISGSLGKGLFYS